METNGTNDAPMRQTNDSHDLAILNYDAAAIRAEFKTYQAVLPSTAELLQEHPSVFTIRSLLEHPLPKFLKRPDEGGIEPHQALCTLLLNDYKEEEEQTLKQSYGTGCYTLLISILSLGAWYPQWHHPAMVIRDQFYRVAHTIPTTPVPPDVLRNTIRSRCTCPIPNYFLDPEDARQFPPHIALLVMLQSDNNSNNTYLTSLWYRISFSLFAFWALLLRIVLEVIGGAGAIWGGAEVVGLRDSSNALLWRWISIFVGVLCLGRFFALNSPQPEDEGDLLGPAGPWSLRWPVRLRAVCDHPFHYFVRALPPALGRKKEE